MHELRRLLRRSSELPARVVVRKAARLARRRLAPRWLRWRDARFATYASALRDDKLLHFFDVPPDDILAGRVEEYTILARLYLAHRFDLLGSGWVRVHHGMTCAGLRGHRHDPGPAVTIDPAGAWLHARITPPNRAEAGRVWSLVDDGYMPIDWHLDFKTGYHWDETAWYRDIEIPAPVVGVDIKVPWELARCQHLPQLALAHAALARVDPALAERAAREVRNQILDFVATNPPRYGVNWTSPMDVAIRVANWLVAMDLLEARGVEFDEQFAHIFGRSVREHALHVARHLEWTEQVRSNHYLSNVVGLLFAAARRPSDRLTDTWLAFALSELPAEFMQQFGADGANLEASTSYHRLSGEMVVHATALVCAIDAKRLRRLPAAPASLGAEDSFRTPPERRVASLVENGRLAFPAWYRDRLIRMAEFTRDVTRPDGAVAQFGDNDSGRFLKIAPSVDLLTVAQLSQRYAEGGVTIGSDPGERYPDENILDHRHFVAAVAGLCIRPDWMAFAPGSEIEYWVVHALATRCPGSAWEGVTATEAARVPASFVASEWPTILRNRDALGSGHVAAVRVPARSAGLRAGLRHVHYPDFGLYLYRSPRLFLAIRCGSVGQGGNGGHAHNDQLSIELWLDGLALCTDPGTFVYTPLPDVRNAYRSVRAHCAPRVDSREPGNLDASLFLLPDTAHARCLRFDHDGFAGTHSGYGFPVYRQIVIDDDGLSMCDWSAHAHPHPWRLGEVLEPAGGDPVRLPVSPKYGCLLR